MPHTGNSSFRCAARGTPLPGPAPSTLLRPPGAPTAPASHSLPCALPGPGTLTSRPGKLSAPPDRLGCGAKAIMHIPIVGTSRYYVQRSADGVRVNGKPFFPGHHPAPREVSGVNVKPDDPGHPQAPPAWSTPPRRRRSAKRAWHALRPPFCCPPVGDGMGFDSLMQLLPHPHESREGEVINGSGT